MRNETETKPKRNRNDTINNNENNDNNENKIITGEIELKKSRLGWNPEPLRFSEMFRLEILETGQKITKNLGLKKL